MSCHGGDPVFERPLSPSSLLIAGTTGRVLRAIRPLLSIRTSPATINLVEMAAKHGGIRKSGNVIARVCWHQIDVILVLFMKPRRMVMCAPSWKGKHAHRARLPCPRAEAERKSARRPVSRVLSAPFGARRPFLWDVPRGTPHATNPDGETGMSPLRPMRTVATAPIRSCSRWGLPCRPRHRGRGALLPPRFTLAHRRFPSHGRFVFCGTVPGVAPAGR